MAAPMRAKLLTAMVAARTKAPGVQYDPKVGGVAFSRYMQDHTLRSFNALNAAQQTAVLRRVWEYLVTSEPVGPQAETMTEYGGDSTGGTDPLPTSLRPLDRRSRDVALVRRVPNAWRDFTIGFRVDGKKTAAADDLTGRLTQHGCTVLAHNAPVLMGVRGMDIAGMPPDNDHRVFFWYGNRDVFNETATCVSRSLLGATAFPLRSTDSAKLSIQWHYLLALDCRGHPGVDSEAWQQARGHNNHWRPGEKAFLGVPANRIVGWAKLLRAPRAGGGWKFLLPANTWTWLNRVAPRREAYLVEELGAWEPNVWYSVPGTYDFAA
jgi:hypothetical protein